MAIREGQERGEIEKPEEGKARGAATRDEVVTYNIFKPKPTEFAGKYELSSSQGGIYAMTDDVTDDQFDQAITEARTLPPGRTAHQE